MQVTNGLITVTITGLAHDLTGFNGGKYDSESGSWTGTAAEFNALTFNAGEDGVQNLTITATTTGAEAGSTSESYTLTVSPIPEAPSLMVTPTHGLEGSLIALNISASGQDADDNVAVNISGVPAGGKLTNSEGQAYSVNKDGSYTLTQAQLGNLYLDATNLREGQVSLHVAVTNTTNGEMASTSRTDTVTIDERPNDLVATLSTTTTQQGAKISVLKVQDDGTTVTTGLSYAWQESVDGKNWTTVSTGSSFTPGEADEGKFLQLVVSYAEASGTDTATYSLGQPNDMSFAVDSTTAQQGLAIHVSGVKDGGTNATSSEVNYAWQVSSDSGHTWTTVGTNSSYTPASSVAGDLLQVVVTYHDSGESESETASFGTVAAAKTWSSGTQSWQTAAQWSPAGAPTSTDNAVVDASGTYTVKVDQAATAHSLVVNDAGATVEVFSGNTLTIAGNVTIEAGKLQINSGGILKDVAASALITGAFTDNGVIESAGKLEIASTVSSGVGLFKIDAGSSLQFDHADTLNVAFAGSGLLILENRNSIRRDHLRRRGQYELRRRDRHRWFRHKRFGQLFWHELRRHGDDQRVWPHYRAFEGRREFNQLERAGFGRQRRNPDP